MVQNLVRCKKDLQAWHKAKISKMKEQIASLKCKIEAIQGGPYSLASKIEEEDLTTKLNKLWEQEEMYWHQRSRLNYLKFGDRHSRFFHITATQRRQRNLILRLKNEKEEWINSPRGISNIICQHFNNLFTDVNPIINSDKASLITTLTYRLALSPNLPLPYQTLTLTIPELPQKSTLFQRRGTLSLNLLPCSSARMVMVIWWMFALFRSIPMVRTLLEMCVRGFPMSTRDRMLPRWKGRWWLASNSHTPNADFGLECSRSWATFDFPGIEGECSSTSPLHYLHNGV